MATPAPQSAPSSAAPERGPLVSIGLPVYNGGDYLASSIASLLGQTCAAIELIISDNASTDGTEAVCRQFAARDSRVRYLRLPENIGGVANHNRVAELARGEFFMWASGDDLWEPTYVERCLEVLRADPGVVLAYAINANIDEQGRHLRDVPPGPRLDGDRPAERFAELTDINRVIEPFYGLMRVAALRRVAPMTRHPGFDRILLAELALLGKMRQVPLPLYRRRIHASQSVNAYPSLRARYQWINPTAQGRMVWPHVAYARHFTAAALRSAPGLGERLACLWYMLRWCRWNAQELLADVTGGDG